MFSKHLLIIVAISIVQTACCARAGAPTRTPSTYRYGIQRIVFTHKSIQYLQLSLFTSYHLTLDYTKEFFKHSGDPIGVLWNA